MPPSGLTLTTTHSMAAARAASTPRAAGAPQQSALIRRRWIFSLEALARSPSRADGVTEDEERSLRHQACALLRKMAKSLLRKRDAERIRNVVCTAMLYAQRFFAVQSLRSHSFQIVAAACLMLASKAEEAPLRASDLAGALVATTFPASSRDSESIERMRIAILEKEHVLLFTLAFDVAVRLPFPWVDRAMASLKKHLSSSRSDVLASDDACARVVLGACSLIEDSFFTIVPLVLTPKEMAVAALALALRIVTGRHIPEAMADKFTSAAKIAFFIRTVLEHATSFVDGSTVRPSIDSRPTTSELVRHDSESTQDAKRLRPTVA